MPTRLCHTPSCPREVAYRGYCQIHQRQVNRATHRHRKFYNGKKWRMAARHKKFLNPICEHCDTALSQEVHHDPPLHELLGTGRDPYDPAVLVALCKTCHGQATRKEQATQ